ncbi:thiol-disulfide oxidoreductase LTO1 [Neltuma alba]|uniref:thiol-disulfide oxidoreductase LTO1 n=1 Tax=Neltuma alba TaxID=207710 RepID=UPI0010A50DAE|nr:thiol-disulfide oxidoreductase LTO1 [Prosopis alba]
MASFVNISPSCCSFLSRWPPIRHHRSVSQRRVCFFNKISHPRLLVLSLKCSQNSESDSETSVPSPSSSGDFTIKLSAAIGGIGFLETAYLTYLKLTNSEAFCPIGGGSCSDVLNSDYALLFGVPLPLIGMAAYGLVAAISIQLSGEDLPLGVKKSDAQLVLLGSTTSMAVASAYFLYILSTKFSGSFCSYCLLSALLSFGLFFITVKDLGWREMQKAMGLQLLVASLVLITLNTSFASSKSISSSLAEVELPYYSPEITVPSSPFALSLARHLQSIGAKMYGAFWCSHCLEQKEMFGREAVKLLDYVECFPEGYRTGTKMTKACTDVKIEGFPTWIINGQVVSGELELPELARVSGFNEPVQPS